MLKKYKKVLLGCVYICVLILVGMAIGALRNSRNVKTDVKLSYYTDSIDKLSNDSYAIVIGTAAKDSRTVTVEGVDFILTKVNVKDVIKGDNNKFEVGKTITLLQTKCDEDPVIQNDGQTLLFLNEYEGPVTTDTAYVCKGLYQGQYKIKDGKIQISDVIRKNNSKLADSVESKNDLVSSLKEKFKP